MKQTVLYLIRNRINAFVGMKNGKVKQAVQEHGQPMKQIRGLLSRAIKTKVSLQANEFDFRSVLHRQSCQTY